MADFQVTNTNDSGQGSLRQAILDANASNGSDRIIFSSSLKGKTIDLTGDPLAITDSVSIDGDINNDGQADITVTTSSESRIFQIDDSNNKTVKDVRIEGLIIESEIDFEDITGAGIYNREKLTLINSKIQNIDSYGGQGLGLFNEGIAKIRGTTFSNLGGDYIRGSAIFNSGTLKFSDGSISESSGYYIYTILNSGVAKFDDSTFSGNGYFDNSGKLTANNIIIADNFRGGLINSEGGKSFVNNSTITGNSSEGNGGGIANRGYLKVTNSSITGNSAGREPLYDSNRYGGGIFNSATGTAIIVNSTISDNKAQSYEGSYEDAFSYGGGIASFGRLLVQNSTITGNEVVRNTNVPRNKRLGLSKRGGGIFIGSDNGQTSTATLSSTLIPGNSAEKLSDVATSGNNVTLNVTNSLIEVGGSQVNGTNINNIFRVDPKLDPAGLKDNGGTTETIALLPGSPAIDAGITNGLSTDQRGTGFKRVAGGQADIGAFEAQPGGDIFENRTIQINKGVGTIPIVNFGGFGSGQQPGSQALSNLDTLKFVGDGLTAKNLIIDTDTDRGDLVLQFDGIDSTRVVLKNFQLQDLENSNTVGNIIFAGQSEVTNSFDVIGQSANPRKVSRRNTTTFLNDTDNRTKGRDNSNDVINAQAGDDKVFGLGGRDVLRGEAGNDTLGGGGGRDLVQGGEGKDRMFGGDGNDTMFGGDGADVIRGNENNDVLSGGEGFDTLTGGSGRDVYAFSASDTRWGQLSEFDTDLITDFKRGQDKIGLDKQTFSALNLSGSKLKASDFASVANDRRVDSSSSKIVFSRSSGGVFYNENGKAEGLGRDGNQFAKLNGIATLAASDFMLM
ncbi:MAG: choice-of-anchor Q domain-containing protein [Cyanobacteria bacterium P01_E01_bin.45]